MALVLISGALRKISHQVQKIGNLTRKYWVAWKYPDVSFGDNTMLGRGLDIRCTDGGKIEIGSNTTISDCCLIVARNGLIIGDHSFIGRGSHIVATDNIELGPHCLIGAKSTVTKGCTIGDHAVVGANSVVTRNVPPYTVAAGSPAIVKRAIRVDDEDR